MEGENMVSDRRTKYTLAQIRSATFSLLESKERNKISVTDICNLADINRGTFYKYYNDVDDLFEKIEQEFLTEFEKIFEQDSPDGMMNEQKLSEVLNFVKEKSDVSQALHKANYTSTLTKRIFNCVLPTLSEQIMIRKPDISMVEASYIAEFYLLGGSGMVTKWINDGMQMEIPQLQKLILEQLQNII